MSAYAQKLAAPVITRGIVPAAARVGIYGPEGIGKSTLAAQFPDAIFADVEGGTAHLDIARFPRPQSWTDINAAVNWLLADGNTSLPVPAGVFRRGTHQHAVALEAWLHRGRIHCIMTQNDCQKVLRQIDQTQHVARRWGGGKRCGRYEAKG